MDSNSDNVHDVAVAFVGCVWEYNEKQEMFPDNTKAVAAMLALVQSAGFKVTGVTRGLLHGDYLDQDGSKTGETYGVNRYPWKVVNRDGDDYAATKWLDIQFKCVRHNGLGDGQHKIIKQLEQAVLDSRPLPPIILTDIGDALREHQREVTHKGSRDTDKLGSGVGVHAECNGFVDRYAVSKTHDALSCRRCNLRVGIPKETKTYGDLRRHFLRFNS